MSIIDYSKALPDAWPVDFISLDCPPLSIIHEINEYTYYDTSNELVYNVSNVYVKILQCHNKMIRGRPIMTKCGSTIFLLFVTEITLLNYNHLKSDAIFKDFCRKMNDQILQSCREFPPTPELKEYLVFFSRKVDPNQRIKARQNYIEFVFTRFLGKTPAKTIAKLC